MTITPIALYYLYFIFSAQDSQLCLPEDRTTSCSSEENGPFVCAVYSGDECYSPTGFCQKTVSSTCLACNDPSIIGYTLGECQQTVGSLLCAEENLPTECPSDDAAPVCGYAFIRRLGGQRIYGQTWSNSCEACDQDQVIFHVPGECQDPDTLGICNKDQRNGENCQASVPACAYYTDGDCTEQLCRKTVTNSCDACADFNVLFTVPGACEPVLDSEEGPVVVFTFQEQIYEDVDSNIVINIDNEDGPDEELVPDPQPDGSINWVVKKPHKKAPRKHKIYLPDPPIPMLEAVLQPDGTYLYEEVKPKKQVHKKKTQQQKKPKTPKKKSSKKSKPVVQPEEPVVLEPITPPEVVVVEKSKSRVPEIKQEIQADGSLIFEVVRPSVQGQETMTMPELNASVGSDGSVTYTKKAGKAKGFLQFGADFDTEDSSEIEPIEQR